MLAAPVVIHCLQEGCKKTPTTETTFRCLNLNVIFSESKKLSWLTGRP